MPRVPQARLSVVAEFPEHFFVENIAVRADGSMLITVLNRNELWYVPAAGDTLPVQPQLLGNFEFNTTFGSLAVSVAGSTRSMRCGRCIPPGSARTWRGYSGY